MQAVLCLDFDGVLCDSIDECFVSAYSAYYSDTIDTPGAAPADNYQYFCRYRYLVAPADDFFLLFHAFEKGIRALDRSTFEYLKTLIIPARASFTSKFFQYRSSRKQNSTQWTSLHRTYQQSSMVSLGDFPKFYIVTTKDRDSVERLAACHGYAHKLLGVYSREISVDKSFLFEKLFADTGINPEMQRVVFVDDNQEHLEQVKQLPLDSFLAGWGYTGPLENCTFPVIQSLNQLEL